MNKIPVGVLGATGFIGQHYVKLLQDHPFFTLVFLASSERCEGMTYGEAVAGQALFSFSKELQGHIVQRIDAVKKAAQRCRLVFSALKSDVAKGVEEQYAAAGMAVFSHASYHRHDPDMPLLIPEINADHLNIIPFQQRKRGWKKGCIVVKPNCTLQGYLLPLYPLHRHFMIRKLFITTMQAISGAGSHFTLENNILPYIAKEEEKSERESLKVLGRLERRGIIPARGVSISAHCNRVPVEHGHLTCVSVEFEKKPQREEILEIWRSFRGAPQLLNLPTAPKVPIIYLEESDRPQPLLDRDREKGMAVTVGRLRECPLLDYRFTSLSHNLMRGGAGGGILSAEMWQQWLQDPSVLKN
jgi:aspartate-semialdehyde dehydrogenase